MFAESVIAGGASRYLPGKQVSKLNIAVINHRPASGVRALLKQIDGCRR